MRQFYVYILSSRSRQLYIGVTRDICRRLHQHRTTKHGFTAQYFIDRLVYVEMTFDPRSAIAREKQLKGWRRSRKVELIARDNPAWNDLSTAWCDSIRSTRRTADPSLRSG